MHEPKPSVRQRIILGIFLLGSVIRFAHLAFVPVDLPHAGGGLFTEFAHQIAANGFRLPCRIPFYTDGGIPFAYPPLPFYVEAVFTEILGLPDFFVANLLPPVVAILALAVFSRLTQELGMGFWTRATALLAFATMGAAFYDQTEASGLAEASGSLSLTCFAIGLTRAYKHGAIKDHIVAGLLWAFCIVASPGSAYASVPTFVIFAIARLAQLQWRPSLRDIGLLVTSGLTALLVSSPYWLAVISNHGIQIFLSSLGGQYQETSDLWEDILQFRLTGRTLFWNVMFFLGMAWALVAGLWPLVAWAVVLRSIPREGWWLAATPAAILIGYGGTRMFASPLVGLLKQHERKTELVLLVGAIASLILAPVGAIISEKGNDPDSYPEAVAAMEWVRANTPSDSKFIVMVNENVLEWSPRVMQRTVLNEIFGTEFTAEKQRKVTDFKDQLSNCRDFDCIQSTLRSSGVVSPAKAQSYSEEGVYLLMSRPHLSKLARSSDGGETTFGLVWENARLAVGILLSPDFEYQMELDDGLGIGRVGEIPDHVLQGSLIDLELHWVGREVPAPDTLFNVSLVDEDGVPRQTWRVRPFADPPREDWAFGIVALEEHPLQVNPHLPSGRYRLTVRLAGKGAPVTLARLCVDPLPRTFEPAGDLGQRLGVQFGDRIQLVGYDLVQEPDTVELTLYWRALEQPEHYYKVFVHLFDPVTESVLAQHDAVPRSWTYPTTWWQAGEIVADEISLSLADVPAGQYRLGVGLYIPDTGERLPVIHEARQPQVPGRFVLPEEITR